MRIINTIIYFVLFFTFGYVKLGKQKETPKMESICRYLKKHGYLFVVLIVFNTISFAMTFQREEKNIYIERNGYSGEEQNISILLKRGEEKQENVLQVERQRLTEKQQEKKMDEAFASLEDTMLGENHSWNQIESDLNFQLDQETFPFDVEFVPDDYELINGDGYVKNMWEELCIRGYTEDDIENGIATKVTVTLWYGTKSCKKEYKMTVFQRKKTAAEQQFEEVMNSLKDKEKKSIYKEGFRIPTSVDGVEVSLANQSILSSGSILLAGVILIGLLILREKENEKQAEKQIQEKLRKCYPWFVNEMMLLLGAGMQVKHIFSTMIAECGEDMNRQDDREPLIKEIARAKCSMDNGVSEEQVYYQLGRRLKLPCYIKLMTLLEQNVTRGTKGLTGILETEEMAALEERKNLARRYGEEAGTKLLGPMILLLLVVMLMIMIPAFLSFE